MHINELGFYNTDWHLIEEIQINWGVAQEILTRNIAFGNYTKLAKLAFIGKTKKKMGGGGIHGWQRGMWGCLHCDGNLFVGCACVRGVRGGWGVHTWLGCACMERDVWDGGLFCVGRAHTWKIVHILLYCFLFFFTKFVCYLSCMSAFNVNIAKCLCFEKTLLFSNKAHVTFLPSKCFRPKVKNHMTRKYRITWIQSCLR